MCKTSSPQFPLFSLLIATGASSKGGSIGQHFARHGCEVHYAFLNEVLADVQQHRPDCLLISTRHDGTLSGIEICRRVRALSQSPTKTNIMKKVFNFCDRALALLIMMQLRCKIL